MKTKNVVLGLIALVFAAGSAFASMFTATDAYIDVQYQGSQTWNCIKVGTCDDPSLFACNVFISDLSQNALAHPINCPTNTLTHTSSTAVTTYDDAGTIVAWR